MTGGRIKRIQDYIDDTFCLTYGDALANIDLSKLILFHKNHLNFKFKNAIKLVKITKCLNLVSFLLLPKYIFIYIKCLKINL